MANLGRFRKGPAGNFIRGLSGLLEIGTKDYRAVRPSAMSSLRKDGEALGTDMWRVVREHGEAFEAPAPIDGSRAK